MCATVFDADVLESLASNQRSMAASIWLGTG
jgi:hypothetical protein